MRTYIILLLSLVTSLQIFSQHVQMPAHTKAAIQIIQKDLNQNRDTPSKHVLDYYPIYKSKAGYQIAVLGKINVHFDKQQAIEDGLDVGAVIGSIVSMRMPLQWLREDFL